MTQLRSRDQVERWLTHKPVEAATIIAARSALRVLPVLGAALKQHTLHSKLGRETILPLLRGTAVSWVAATWPNKSADIRSYSHAGYKAAVSVSNETINLAPIARAVYAAAYSVAETNKQSIVSAAAASTSYAASAFQPGYSYNPEKIEQDYDRQGRRIKSPARDSWKAVSDDAAFLEESNQVLLSSIDLSAKPIWNNGIPSWISEYWSRLKEALVAADENWEVWTEWYEKRLHGGPINEALEIARVKIDESIWHSPPKSINSHIEKLLRQFLPTSEQIKQSRSQLAEVVSPAPSLTSDHLLHAGPNEIYDVPLDSADLITLPIRQCAIIVSILAGLPAQTPKHTIAALEQYAGELRARGVRPILGLLKEMAAIIEADVTDPNSEKEWLESGLRVAFKQFFANNKIFSDHFPLDLRRDELYARILVDETAAVGPALSSPFVKVASAASEAHNAGITTEDFTKIVASLADFAKVASTIPPKNELANTTSSQVKEIPPIPTVTSGDRVVTASTDVSATKRTVLTGIGFFERAYNLLASTAQLTGPPEGNALLVALRNALDSLLKLLR